MEEHTKRPKLDITTTKGIRFHKVDKAPEEEFLTALIVSTPFIERIKSIYSKQYFDMPSVPLVAEWVFEYYDKYQKAPGLHIQDIFNEKKKKLKPERADWVSEFLTKLSGKYGEEYEDNDINPDYVYDVCVKYLENQRLLKGGREIQDLVAAGKTDKAEEVLTQLYESKQALDTTQPLSQLKEIAIDLDEFLEEHIEPPMMVFDPWLTDGCMFEIFSEKGMGKTWLALTIGVLLTRENAEGRELGPYWKTVSGSGVLYVDGEMNEYEVQDRTVRLKSSLGPSNDKYPFTLMSSNRLARMFHNQINIAKKEWRDAITQFLESGNYQLLILDNLASLTQDIDENSKQEWDPINQWLIYLRHMGVATGFLHHAGKSGQQRGTSARDDNLDVIIVLTKPGDYKESDGAYFRVSFKKHRNIAPGKNIQDFAIQLTEDVDDNLVWKERRAIVKKEKDALIVALILDGRLKGKEIAKKAGVSEPWVTGWKQRLVKEGLYDKGLKEATLEGRKWLIQQDIDLSFYYENGEHSQEGT